MDVENLIAFPNQNQNQNRQAISVLYIEESVARQALKNEKINWSYMQKYQEVGRG